MLSEITNAELQALKNLCLRELSTLGCLAPDTVTSALTKIVYEITQREKLRPPPPSRSQ